MRTVGIDLAAARQNTAVAVIEWNADTARIAAVETGADDEMLLAGCDGADRIGIDCPLGWPDAFVAMVGQHHEGVIDQPSGSAENWRRSLAKRRTDRFVRDRCGITPLSVSCDLIGHVAFRGAELQRRFAERSEPVDRSGATGRIVEAYPAAALKAWSLRHNGYKGKQHAEARHALVGELDERTPWLDFGEHLGRCRDSDHVLDAVITALIARAAAIGRVHRPATEADRAAAQREGWIAVPDCRLGALQKRPK